MKHGEPEEMTNGDHAYLIVGFEEPITGCALGEQKLAT